jgi:hypothetical protein
VAPSRLQQQLQQRPRQRAPRVAMQQVLVCFFAGYGGVWVLSHCASACNFVEEPTAASRGQFWCEVVGCSCISGQHCKEFDLCRKCATAKKLTVLPPSVSCPFP